MLGVAPVLHSIVDPNIYGPKCIITSGNQAKLSSNYSRSADLSVSQIPVLYIYNYAW